MAGEEQADDPHGAAAAPLVTVIVATFRRPERMRKLLHALEAQDLPREDFEVVVCDDCSGDEAASELQRLLESSPLTTRLVRHTRNEGPGRARNTAAAAARGSVLASTDDDCEPQPGWLRAGLASLEPGVNAVVGKVAPNPGQRDQIGAWSRTLTVNDALYFQAANVFISRPDFEAVGGFDADFDRGGEDTDLGMRIRKLGREVVFAEDALVFHDIRAGSVYDLMRENLWKWVDLPRVCKKHPEIRRDAAYLTYFWKPSHPPLVLAVLGILAAVVGAFVTPWAALALIATVPWLVYRWWLQPRFRQLHFRAWTLPGVFLIDLSEVIAVVRGSFKHRTILI